MPTLHWIGKEKVINHHLDVPYRVLEHQYGFEARTGKQNSPTNGGNKIIHGDNLEALKTLLPEYEGRIKCIYIDPPYNTGNEGWEYNDNVNDPKIKKWLGRVVGKESEDLSRHDKWLCMMYPRLKLLQKLLTDDGVLLISIDDNEVSSLKMILNEIFGESGLLGTFVWRRRVTSSMSASWISTDHEYVVAYSKNPDLVDVFGEERDMDKYNIPDGTGRFYASMPLTVGMNKEMRPNQWYELKDPNSDKTYWPTQGRVWAYYPPTMIQKIQENKIIWPSDFPGKKLTTPRLKSYPEDAKRDRKPLSTWIYEVNVEIDNFEFNYLQTSKNEEGAKILKQIFDESVFNYAKPLSLVESFIRQFTKKTDIILDSFAGSGTTAHAVLNLNKQDSGVRQFILIEMNTYADSLTSERVKKVINGYGKEPKVTAGTGGNFDYYTLGEPLFLEDGLLNEAVGVEKIRQYVYYTETQQPLSTEEHGDNAYFLQHNQDTSYYFYYEPEGVTTLDHTFLSTMHTKAEQYIIYADNCLLTPEYMSRHHIIFKKIPRDITRF